MKQKLLWLSSLTLAANGCVTIQPFTVCSVAGELANGGICASQPSGLTTDLDFDQFLNFLEAAPATAQTPAKAAAVCMSAQDWGQMKSELEQACRELGATCSYSIKSFLAKLNK